MTLELEAGKKYRTRGGDEVEILRTDLNSVNPVLGILTVCDGTQSACEWAFNGAFWFDGPQDDMDIVSEIKLKRVVWLNVYEGDEGALFYPSRQQANCWHEHHGKGDNRIACIRVEFEEGQFDE
jgi:hypothetical protein